MALQANSNNKSTKNDIQRKKWKVGSKVEIYSDSKSKWIKGNIIKIFHDDEGEWLQVKYSGFSVKEIQRYNQFIRPIQKKKQNKNKDKTKSKQKSQSISPKSPSKSTLTSSDIASTKKNGNGHKSDHSLDYQRNINKYKDLLKSTFNQLLPNKEEVGLYIYNSIVFDTTIGGGNDTSIKPTAVLFQNTDLKQQGSAFMDMLNTVIMYVKFYGIFFCV